ncbi:uncharacterized protein EV422DRAFT_510395 [Fimicolochytrium jonesii]|uniref:uncharacterized protein n=1 Tax=Fimicolochytrium jonesii TaxID=1396493 RepID=UPI0022FDB6BF|nr:uncharacterized protein EV422DRAFT_510395 [Fimicolochytrium jonesii]KAI8815648.1 hypothetical protein EV422DRAFT_510395 [Fimicolochytrium jonesii]
MSDEDPTTPPRARRTASTVIAENSGTMAGLPRGSAHQTEPTEAQPGGSQPGSPPPRDSQESSDDEVTPAAGFPAASSSSQSLPVPRPIPGPHRGARASRATIAAAIDNFVPEQPHAGNRIRAEVATTRRRARSVSPARETPRRSVRARAESPFGRTDNDRVRREVREAEDAAPAAERGTVLPSTEREAFFAGMYGVRHVGCGNDHEVMHSDDPDTDLALQRRHANLSAPTKVKNEYESRGGPHLAKKELDLVMRLAFVDLDKFPPDIQLEERRQEIVFEQSETGALHALEDTPGKPCYSFGQWDEAFDYYTQALVSFYPSLVPQLNAYRRDIRSKSNRAGTRNWPIISTYDKARRRFFGNRTGLPRWLWAWAGLLVMSRDEDGNVYLENSAVRTNAANAGIDTEWISVSSSTGDPNLESRISEAARVEEQPSVQPTLPPTQPQPSPDFHFQETTPGAVDYGAAFRYNIARGIHLGPREQRPLFAPTPLIPTRDLILHRLTYPEPLMTDVEFEAADALLQHDCYLTPCPINPTVLRLLTTEFPNQVLVHQLIRGIQSGYPLQYTGPCTVPLQHNHPSADTQHRPFADDMTKEHVADRRRPLPPELLMALPYKHSVPVACVPKETAHDGTVLKWRIVNDASFPHGSSLNDAIAPRAFGECHLDKVDILIQDILTARAQYPNKPLVLWKVDWSDAYRINPVRPANQALQLILHDARWWLDHAMQFGCRSSGHVCCLQGNLVAWILQRAGVPKPLHYVDDHFGVTLAELGSQTLRTVISVCKALGIPVKPSKTAVGSTLAHLGFLFDLDAFSISLPPLKKTKVLKLINDARATAALSLKPLEELTSLLTMVGQLLPYCRLYLSDLWAHLAVTKTRRRAMPWTPRSLQALTWFHDTLHEWGGSRLLIDSNWYTSTILGAAGDSGRRGFGLVTDTTFTWGTWCIQCYEQHPSSAFELIAIDIGVWTFGPQFTRSKLLWATDNEGNVYAYGNSRSTDPASNDAIRSIHSAISVFQFDMRLHYVPRKHVFGCDLLTRGGLTNFKLLHPTKTYLVPQIPRYLHPRPDGFGLRCSHTSSQGGCSQ